MNIRPLPDTPRLRRDLMRAELELCARAIAKFDPTLKRTGESSWGTGKRVDRQPAPSGGERVSGLESGQGFCEVRENVG